MDFEHPAKGDYTQYRPVGYLVNMGRGDHPQPILDLSYEFRSYIDDIRELDHTLRSFVLMPEDYIELLISSGGSNIYHSTKAGGNDLSEDEVRTVIRRFTSGESIVTLDADEVDVINHLRFITRYREFSIPWNLESILRIHAILSDGLTGDCGLRAKDITIRNRDGEECFLTTPGDDVKDVMESVLDWLSKTPFDAIVSSIILCYLFERVHPFTVSNGRMGRLTFMMHMHECGLRYSIFCPILEELLSDRRVYDDLFTYTNSTTDYSPLIRYFIECIHNAYLRTLKEFEGRDILKDCDEPDRRILVNSRRSGDFTLHDAVSWTGIGEQATRNRLNRLVEIGLLNKEGHTRNLTYSFADPLITVAKRIREGSDSSSTM